MNLTDSLYPDVTGVLLAGGRSRRMGCDKALLQINGQPLYLRVIAVMQELFKQILIAGDRPDLELPNIQSHADSYPGSSLAGIHTGLSAATSDWIFIAPCDMPYPDRRIFELLLQRRDQVSAVIASTAGMPEPVFGLYHRSCLLHVEEMLQQNYFRIQELFKRIPVRLVDSAEFPQGWQRAMANVNTPEDLQQVLKQAP
jgi:molybdopterin-guanine dinucleotide biosynthesis protein A